MKKLLARSIFKRDSFRPRLHRHASLGCDYVVSGHWHILTSSIFKSRQRYADDRATFF
jgi:hypothetical protein